MKKQKRPTKAQVRAAQKVITLARDCEGAEQVKHKKTLIGKYYKTRNSYGGGEESWWLYRTPTHIKDGWSLAGLEFQETSRGNFEMNVDAYCEYIDKGGYVEISKEEFDTAKAEFVARFLERVS